MNPIVINAPGAKTNISAGEKLAGVTTTSNNVPFPKISLIEPNTVKAKVNPSPEPIPSNRDGNTGFFEAKLSALPSTIQLTTIRGINKPNTA